MIHNRFTISIITYNRKATILELLKTILSNQILSKVEIIVIDNNSIDGTADAIASEFPDVKLIRLPKNIGTEARNIGILNSQGEYVITIDDDVFFKSDNVLAKIEQKFSENIYVGAIVFKIKDYYSDEISEWGHNCDPKQFHGKEFITSEIQEGAVVFRKAIFNDTGLYPPHFFISHEGSDLACRMINYNWSILYAPDIEVLHKYVLNTRKTWRRYFYDTRNHFWLATRNYRFIYGTRHILKKSIIMFVYSLRDGFFIYWLAGLVSGIFGSIYMLKYRNKLSKKAEKTIKDIESSRPGVLNYLKRRLFKKSIRI